MPAASAPLDFCGSIPALATVTTVEPPAAWRMPLPAALSTRATANWSKSAYGALGVGLAFVGAVVVHAVPATRAHPTHVGGLPLASYFSLGPHILPYALFLVLNIHRTLQQLGRPCLRADESPDETTVWLLPDDGAASVERQVAAIDSSAADMYRTGVEFTLLSMLLIVS